MELTAEQKCLILGAISDLETYRIQHGPPSTALMQATFDKLPKELRTRTMQEYADHLLGKKINL